MRYVLIVNEIVLRYFVCLLFSLETLVSITIIHETYDSYYQLLCIKIRNKLQQFATDLVHFALLVHSDEYDSAC